MTLDCLFNDLILRSIKASTLESTRVYLDMALRVQNQTRKTFLAINSLKNPPPKQFVEQQNIALNQQVNNGSLDNVVLKPELNKIKPENKLLCEAKHAPMDFRGTQEAIRINPSLEAVEIGGRQNSRGQSY